MNKNAKDKLPFAVFICPKSNVDELEDAIKNIAKFEPAKYENNNQKMINIIENFIEKI